MNELYQEERRGQKLRDLAVRREERKAFRERELEAAEARIQRQREEHAWERRFLENYATEAAQAAAEQQAWAAGAARRHAQQLSNQADLQTELKAVRSELFDEQALLHVTKQARQQEEAAALQFRSESSQQLASLHTRLRQVTAKSEAIVQQIPKLRKSLQDEKAASSAQALLVQRRRHCTEELEAQTAVLQQELFDSTARAEAMRDELKEDAAEHKRLAEWQRTLLEAHETDKALKLEAWEQRKALARRAERLASTSSPSVPADFTVRMQRLLP
eukprot:TRINITY_DN39791_c0_g1_i1.p1 TRINITY_DN39791_c0_g1~~TRINITY_DN39791_c0_g1_i1.p1  ORF type:complete len:275 (-),score=96.13 TRINITY_DN39791_c0_g1_i1:94-918(-)